MIRRSVFLAALFLIALGGASGPGAPGAWTVVRDGSTIDLSLRALGGERRGRFEEWHGDITFDPDAPGRTRATVVVRAGSLKMQPAVATRRAIGPAFLDSARFPVIRVELRSLEPRGGDRFTARADVTMKGVTRPVTFPVDLRVTAGRAHLTGALSLDRADFGIGTTGAWNRMVGREVTVRVALQARPA